LKNIQLDKQRNILKSVNLLKGGKSYSAEAIEALYKKNIRQLWTDSDGEILDAPKSGEHDLPLYLHVTGETIKDYVVPIDSRGLWGRILGYLAIQSDGSTVSGFTVYKHSETPGLGGEVENQWFQKNFDGKKIVDRDGNFVSISIAKGKIRDKIPEAQRINYVDGISGATLTGKYLTEGIEETLLNYEPLSAKFRENLVKRIPDSK
jgi:Na+-transporting NADH:ubiquinone oxidoreductase subunit C